MNEGNTSIQKSTIVELIRGNHNFLYTKRDKNRPGYQVYFFEETPKLLEDLKLLENENHEKV